MSWELGIEIWEEPRTEARPDMAGGIPRRLFCFDLQSIQTGMCSAPKRSRQGRGTGPGEALLEESKSMSICWATSVCPILVIFQCIISCYSVRDNQGHVSSVQLLSCVWLFVTPWTAARQASLSITNSQSLLKLMSIELVIPFNYLILCCLLLLPPSIFPNIRVFSNESVLHIRWPKYWSQLISNDYSERDHQCWLPSSSHLLPGTQEDSSPQMPCSQKSCVTSSSQWNVNGDEKIPFLNKVVWTCMTPPHHLFSSAHIQRPQIKKGEMQDGNSFTPESLFGSVWP